MLHLLGRNVGGHASSACFQLCIQSTFDQLLPSGYSSALVWTLEDSRIPPAFNSIFLLKLFWHHLGYHITLRIYLYCLCSMPLTYFSLYVFSVFEFYDLHVAYSNWNRLRYRFIFKFFYCVTCALTIPPYFSVSG